MLAYAGGGICRKSAPALRFEIIQRVNEALIARLEQIENLCAVMGIVLVAAKYMKQVAGDQLLSRIEVPRFDALHQRKLMCIVRRLDGLAVMMQRRPVGNFLRSACSRISKCRHGCSFVLVVLAMAISPIIAFAGKYSEGKAVFEI
jgi:hypothetical protein